MMLDDPGNPSPLLTALKSTLSFMVALTPEVISHLRGKEMATVQLSGPSPLSPTPAMKAA
jgi:hypothetical protein